MEIDVSSFNEIFANHAQKQALLNKQKEEAARNAENEKAAG